ncbi:MAG: DUF1501 domain-containing protein [Rhodobacteraceae bacterium]|nr:DUF1501 domain-containing protein [Paracoccaceae bacterium]
MKLNRRNFLLKSGALGCSLAASPLVTPIAMAAAPGDNRLVVIILRGAMDGLDVVRPVGDPHFAALRPGLNQGDDALPLDGFFALHPSLTDLHPLWAKGELAFAHAVSTPYRDKRSHFDGQDILEAGIGADGRIRDGWLNRALAGMTNSEMRTAFAVGREDLLVLSGAAQVSHWSPNSVLTLSPQSRLLLANMYRDTPLFSASMSEAIALAETLDAGGDAEDYGDVREAMMQSTQAGQRGGVEEIAEFTAAQLLEETRIASFSITGWDTHSGQRGALTRALGELQKAIMTLRRDLGQVWQNTTVLAMTEFGRTARENGSGGTDHGTAGALVLAGGAVRGGKVYGDWPGLDELDLYQARDLMPTGDLRAYAGAALTGLFGTSRSALETRVFPGLDISEPPAIIR